MNEKMMAYFILWAFVTFLLLPLVANARSYKDAVIDSILLELVITFIIGIIFSVGWAFKVLAG